MADFKTYILSVVITSVILQMGNLILKDTHYNKFYQNISSVVMMIVLLIPLISILFFKGENIQFDTTSNFEDFKMENVFAEKLEKQIKSDIHQNGFGECDISVKTDWSALLIEVNTDLGRNEQQQLKNYIFNKYCTPKDVVSVSGYN